LKNPPFRLNEFEPQRSHRARMFDLYDPNAHDAKLQNPRPQFKAIQRLLHPGCGCGIEF